MTVYEQQQQAKQEASTKMLCYTLAKLLEMKPSTVADESRLATWAESVDNTAAKLIASIGARDGISTMLRECAELIENEQEVREFLKNMGVESAAISNPWLVLMSAARGLQLHRESERQQAQHTIRELTARYEKCAHELSKAQTDLEDVKEVYRAMMEERRARAPKRVKRQDETSGIAIIDYGDDD